MRRAWRWIGGAVAVLVIAIILIAMFFDWNWLRGPLESRLSSATGKKVHIDAIAGQWSSHPHVRIKGITVTAPGWKPDPQVATIDEVDLVVDLDRLLRGTLSIPELAVNKPVLTLERRANGKANWDIAKEASGPSDRHAVPLIGEVDIRNGKLSYRDPAKHIAIDAAISTVRGNAGGHGEQMDIKGTGTYQHAPFTLALSGDSLLTMREKSTPFKLSVTANMGQTHLTAAGAIQDPIKMTGLAVAMEVSGENAQDLYTYLGIPAPATPPYHLSGTFDRIGRDVWVFRDFGGTVGESDLQGTLRFDLSKPRLFTSGTLYSHQIRLTDLGILVGAPTKPAKMSPDQRRLAENYQHSKLLLPDVPLAVNMVRNTDVDVTFTGAKVLAEDLPLKDIHLRVKIDDGVLSLAPLDVGVAGGKLDGIIVIDGRTDAVKTDANVGFSDFHLGQFISPALEQKAAVTGIVEGRIRFTGTGDTTHKALATSNGAMSLIVSSGTISSLASSLIGLDIARTLGVLVAGNKTMSLHCMVGDFGLQNGTMTVRSLVLATDTTTVTVGGTINLADESLHLKLVGKPKKLTLGLHGPITLGGTIRAPKAGIGTGVVARLGGSAALGVLATPIAAIVAFIEGGSKQPPQMCQSLERRAARVAPPPQVHSAGGSTLRRDDEGAR